MGTTIRVDDDTADRLRALKQQEGKRSMDDLIRDLIEREQHRISMFGEEKDLDSWEEERDRARFSDRDR